MFKNPSTFKKPYNSKYSTNLLQIKQEQTSVLVQRPLSKMDGKLNLSVSYAVDRKKKLISSQKPNIIIWQIHDGAYPIGIFKK